MKKVTAVLIGAGMRGMDSYAPYALSHPDRLKFIAVAEPDRERRKKFSKLHGIPEDLCFNTWEELFRQPHLADAALICTQDRMHFKPAARAFEKGYHVLLEKPMSADPAECIALGEMAKKNRRVLSVCHVLRYTEFFSKLKGLLDAKVIGELVSIQHNENVGYYHYAHSFTRGHWRNSGLSSPMILAKSCHDMDIMLWLADSKCVKLSSFGSLSYFKKENAPKGAPLRCTDGCPAERTCPYSAKKIYLTENTGWPTNVITSDLTIKGRMKALREGPYGRCVFRCDNNVVDHQVADIEFANGVTAAFTMCAFTKNISRTIKLMGTKGELRGVMETNEIEIRPFGDKTEVINTKISKHGHGGGDYGIMRDFTRLVALGTVKSRTSAEVSVQSHLMSFAAERSRLTDKVVFMDKFVKSFKN